MLEKAELTRIIMLSKTKKVITTSPPVLCSIASCKLFYITTWRVGTLSLLFVPPTERRRNGDYHGIMNGLFTSRVYALDSNAEAGLGRLALRIKDKANRRVLLFEFKRSEKEENLDRDCNEAIRQIEKNGYAKTMPDGYGQQIVYGIAFFGKRAKVKLHCHL